MGPYRLLGRLGAGGQGVVYLGQGRDGRPVAVKVMRDGPADERFAKEIDAARRVEPFCIAQVLDASLSGRPYIVTEYVEGPSLQQAGRHSGADLQRLAVATATALTAIHQAGIVHRDFKPANVLLGQGGPRVIDFGIARSVESGLTGTSGIMGTPAYMAPEQLAGAAVGPATDVFAWASVIVFAATGSPPFGEDSLPAVINRILHNEPQLGDLPRPLRTIVLACLDKDPARRPSMQDVLLQLLGGQVPSHPGDAGHSGGPTVPGRSRRGSGAAGARRGGEVRVVAGISGVVALMAAGAVGWGITSGWGATSGREVRTAPPSAQAMAITTTGKTGPTTKRPRPKGTRTPATRKPTPKPTSEPTREPASAPTSSSAKPTRSAASGGGGSFRIASLRAMGARKANTQDCQIGQSNTFGLVEGTRLHTRFRYEWILDGRVVERSEAYIADSHTQQVIGPLVKPDGPHRITLRLTSPMTVSKTLSFAICPVGTE
ncbi:serine/threonine-protein kinase [Nonomuraea africana]|uniref:Ser/Thr protein kinase n=1 Tax=Nonomuraea africana TaxID=46171 RepID=A0ABR9KJR2_9ACTN|nr:serine/threonine-protein kinase [Nonomuraea africana]MBE1561868.1 putative Ser/Thr protein kinase [Nonomuraea africana]